MSSKYSFPLLLLVIVVLFLGVTPASAFTNNLTVQLNEKVTLNEFSMYPFGQETSYTWDPAFFELIRQWQSSPDYQSIKLKAIKCGESTVVFNGVIWNNYYNVNIQCQTS